MDTCRICLKLRKNLRSVHYSLSGITYSEMITSVSNIKIAKVDGITDKICLNCRRKLHDAYEFKLLIERSNIHLQHTAKLRRFNFNNINDIKIKIEIETDRKTSILLPHKIDHTFQNGDDTIYYKDTVIKKINNKNNIQNKQLSVLEFLKDIKTDLDNELDNHFDDNDDAYEPRMTSNNKSAIKYQFKKNARRKELKNVKNSKRIKIKPIKPILLSDLRLVRTGVDKEKPVVKKKYKSQNTRKDICPYCGKFSSSIVAHMLTHTGERNFKCEVCSGEFFTQKQLKAHEKLHTTTRDFKCDKCIAEFKTKDCLKSHMLTHLDVKKYVCEICSKGFKRKSHLRRHGLIHSSSNKTIMCDLCNMSFYSKYGLRHHMRVHTGERPYKCEICSQPYSYKHDFNRHCFKKHGVFVKWRSVHVLDERVLLRERALMAELLQRARGTAGDAPLAFQGPMAALAFRKTIKALQARQLPVDLEF